MAWLADLVAVHILENTTDLFNNTKYHGIYRDDGVAVFNGRKLTKEIIPWLNNFQQQVNKLTGCDTLTFMAVIWAEGSPVKTTENERVTIETSDKFPHLDKEMHWSDRGSLHFGVCLKPNQLLKYLNTDSSHPLPLLQGSDKGSDGQISQTYNPNRRQQGKSIAEIYPKHTEALAEAGYKTGNLPTLQEALAKATKDEAKIKEKETKKKQRNRSVHFCLGHSRFWSKPVHTILKELRDKHKLKWIRISMLYHKFPNLREKFNGDLNKKITEGANSLNFLARPCNCRDKPCGHGNACRQKLVVHQVTCLETGKKCIGNTQQTVKEQMQGHMDDGKSLLLKGEASDSCAKHFALIWQEERPIPKPEKQQTRIK